MWNDAGLKNRLLWIDKNYKEHRGVSNEYLWPPEKAVFSKSSHGHSAPGKLLAIATSLIDRAAKLRKDGIHSVQEAVRGAILANEALELLGNRTPTEAIEALNLKYQFEVLAECQFSGVEFNIDPKPRLAEIHMEVKNICSWFGEDKQKLASMNAEMVIDTAIMRIFREYAQYDEEQTCNIRARKLHNRLWSQQKKINLLARPFLWYIENLLRSFSGFVIVIILWIVVLWSLYYLTGHENIGSAFVDAWSSFFSIGNPITVAEGIKHPYAYKCVTCFAIFLGFTHLGVFVSHLYSILSRK